MQIKLILALCLLFTSCSLSIANEFQSSPMVTLTQDEKEWIKKYPTLVLGSDSSWDPYIVKNLDGSVGGYDSDILKLITQKTGLNIKLVTGKWKDILEKANTQEIDGLSTSVSHTKRAEHFNFSNIYVTSQRLLVVAKNNLKAIHSIEDLKGKRFAYQEKNLFDKKIVSRYKDAIAVPLKSLEEILEKLVKGEIDATIGSQPLMNMASKKNIPYIKVIQYIPNSKLELVFSVRKDFTHAITILNKGLKAIPESKKVALKNKWFFKATKIINPKSNLNLTNEEKAYLLKHPVLKVQNLTSFAPFNFNENQEPKGFTVDYMKLLEKYLDIKIEFVSGKAWNEYLSMLKEGSIDIIPHIAVNEERKKYVDFTNFNHIQYTVGFAIKKDENIVSMQDLKDKTIAVAKKTFLHAFLKKTFPNQKLLLTASTSQALDAVSLGKADAVIGSLPALQYFIHKKWLSNVEVINVDDLGLPSTTELPMGVKKGNTVLKSILEKVNSTIPHKQVMKLKENWMDLKKSDSLTTNSLNRYEREYLKKKKVIRMCVLPNWLPFEQIDENKKHKGIGNDIMKIVSNYIDTPIQLLPTKEWSQSLQNIRDRRCDILPVAMDILSRRDAMNFTKPYVSEPFVIATKQNEFFVKDSQSIGNRKIGIVKSYAFIEVLKEKNPEIKIIHVKNAKDGLERVQRGELFGYVDIMPAVGYTMQKYSMFDLKIAGKLEFDIKLSIASRNDEPMLNAIMQKALDTISKDEIRTIVGKWIAIKVQQTIDYTKLFYVAGFFIIILLLVLYKNRSINRINNQLILANKEIEEQQKMVDKYVLIVNTDLEGVITDANEAYCKSIGYEERELIGNTHSMIRHPHMESSYFEEMWQCIQANKSWVGEVTNYTKNRSVKHFAVYIEPLLKDGIKIGYQSISEDITDKKRIEELSVRDKLTGLYNRLKIDEIMIMEVAQFTRYKTEFSVILLDIDDFKSINDNFGHDVGDIALQEISALLKDSIRLTDVVGRWGGEEFLIICASTNAQNSEVLAEHIRHKIETTPLSKVGIKTVSLGVTQFVQEDTISSFFKRVDRALYEAKKTGKNKTVVY